MSANLNDWRDFAYAWGGVAPTLVPAEQVRKGVNIMTPEVLGTYRAIDGTPVEVSTGTDMEGDRMYGLSYPDGDARSHLVWSLDEVLAELERTLMPRNGRRAPLPVQS
jgi:hypothetical protein